MEISLDYYKVFYFVAKYKSFTLAAEKLYANQPNVTRTVKTLEKQLGCTLFFRSKRKVELTPEGEKLYKHIQIAYEHLRLAEQEIALEKSLQSGAIFIGTSETALYGLLLPILKDFRTKFGEIKLRVGNYTTNQALSALNDGFVDFAIITTPFDKTDKMSVTELKSFREAAVCGTAFPSLYNRKIALKEFVSYPIVGLGHTKTYDYYAAEFPKYGLEFTPDIEVATMDQILPMIENNLGIGFVPEFFLKNNSNIRKIDLIEQFPPRTICLVKRTDRPLSFAAAKLESEIISSISRKTSSCHE